MEGEWREVTLADFAPFAYGKGLPERERDPLGNVPVFGSNGIVGYHSEALTSGPTVIIGRKGTVGAVHFSRKACWPIDTTFFVVDEDAEILRFKYYLLKSLDLEHMNADSAVPGLNRDAAHALKVFVPPVSEQRAIAHILGTLDDKIELNRRMSETLEQMARALFKAWFVDFEPVRAKMEGRWRRGRSLPGLPAHLYDLFPDRLVDSELGQIPEGWEIGKLGDILVQIVDRRSASDETRSRPYVPIECIAARSLLLAESKPGEEAQSSLTRFRKGDLLFGAMRPYFHKVAIAPFDGTTRTTVFVLRPRQADEFSFATLLLHDARTIEYATNHSTGSTIPYAVWQGSLETMPIVLPPAVVRKSFDKIVQPLLDRIPPVFFANRTLAALRDALLPKLIRGEIQVKDAERFVQDLGGGKS